MSKKSSPAPPPAPDPRVTSQAQSDANIATAREQQRLNLINTAGPQGSVNYTADPNAPGGYSQTTTLSPAEQGIYDAQKRTELGATNIAYDQLGRVNTALQTPLNMEGLPGLQGGYGQVPLQFDVANAGSIQRGINDAGGIQRGINDAGSIQSAIGDAGNVRTQIPGLQTSLGQQGPVRGSFDTGPALQYGFDQGQGVQGQVGGNQDLARIMAAGANYQQAASRLDPRFAKAEDSERTRLAAQGFSENSQGYKDALDEFGRTKNDAYDQAMLSSIREGEAAAQGQFGRQLAQGQFANQAAGQQYGQGLGAAQFYNQTAGQQYGQNKGEAEFSNEAQQQQFAQALARMQAENAAKGQGYELENAGQAQQFAQQLARQQAGNAAQQQQFGQNAAQQQALNAAQQQQFGQNATQQQALNQAQQQQFGQNLAGQQAFNAAAGQYANQNLSSAQLANQARNQGLQERAYVQNQPINQLSGLLGLGQVGMPQGVQYSPTQVGQTDVLGAYALNQQAQNAAYQAQMQNRSGLMGGLFSLGSAAIMASDERLKTDKVLIRRRADGLGIWSFRYLDDPQNVRRVGVMAQEVKRIRPDLVVKRPDGFLAVSYADIDLEAA